MTEPTPISFDVGFAQLEGAGEQTRLAPELSASQRSRAVGFQMLMGYFDQPIDSEEAQQTILDLDAERARSSSAKSRELQEALELADFMQQSIGHVPEDKTPKPIFRLMVDETPKYGEA